MRLHCMYSIQVIILLLQTLCMHGGEVVDDSPMLARQGVTQQATHGRSLPSLAALEEGNSRPQGQLGGGVGSGEWRRGVGYGEKKGGKYTNRAHTV